jgi:hypothetical protein
MANYFNFFPSTFYSVDANNKVALDVVTNVISRFSFESQLKENSSVFYPYEIKDSDTPESIAYKLYGNAERHWMVLIFNNIIDPQYDWPLNYNNFVDYVNEKYSANGAANTTVQTGLQWAKSENNVHSYYQVNTRISVAVSPDSKTIKEKVRITANTYANVIVGSVTYTLNNGKTITETTSKEKLTYYDYEMEVNENKRKIKLLKPEFAYDVFEEFKQIIRE